MTIPEKVLLEATYPHNPSIKIKARQGIELIIEICDGYEGISLHGQEIWWLFERLHILHSKTVWN